MPDDDASSDDKKGDVEEVVAAPVGSPRTGVARAPSAQAYHLSPAGTVEKSPVPTECEIVVVGAGVAGASAAYHLSQAGVKDVLVVEAGPVAGQGLAPRHSGSATMDAAPTVKMMCQLYACSSADFIKHHGRDGASRYLRLTAEGLKLQKEIAAQVLDQPSEQLREMGTYYVAYESDREALRQEYETLTSLGCNVITWLENSQDEALKWVPGCSADFDCAIFFPNDAIIDSSAYAKGLIRYVLKEQPSYRFLPNTKVTQVLEGDMAAALVELDSGVRIRCKHVVMATGGLFQLPQLNGILKPCYSYLAHVPVDETTTTNSCIHSPNFVTWGFTHDWCFTNGKIRISGEDHFSAFKPPLCQERCANLAKWTREKYGCDPEKSLDMDSLPQQYGIYSETPDLVPLVGYLNPNSKICYLLGCNAWGQTVFSYASSLVPGLLGYTELTDSQIDSLELLSIHRFSHLP